MTESKDGFLEIQRRIIGQKIVNIIWDEQPIAVERWNGSYIANIAVLVLESGALVYIENKRNITQAEIERLANAVDQGPPGKVWPRDKK